MRRNYYLTFVITVALAFAFAGPVKADKFSDTIAVYKKAEAVQPFLHLNKQNVSDIVNPVYGRG